MPGLAMVTGASSGIGEAYAERLAADGCDLMIVARRVDRLEQLAARLRGEHHVNVDVIGADLGKPEEIATLCEAVSDAPLEMLVNNAGLAHYMPFAELPPPLARELLEVNLASLVLLSRAAVPGMIERDTGSIVNIASLLAFSGEAEQPFLPKRAVYAATKSFVVTFSQVLAREVRDHGVRVQVVCPGVVRSEFHSRQGMDMSEVPRMEAPDVVRASLMDLANGVVVSVPGLTDPEALAQVKAANAQLLGATRVNQLPPRYSRPDGP
ncbi:MAG TPA: SDR family oxidoreductase [Solirubrobacteraceae bacterium]|nr:SDR family oxidoreductase [Solirubrobacteraceae bacterium]